MLSDSGAAPGLVAELDDAEATHQAPAIAQGQGRQHARAHGAVELAIALLQAAIPNEGQADIGQGLDRPGAIDGVAERQLPGRLGVVAILHRAELDAELPVRGRRLRDGLGLGGDGGA